MGNLFGTIREQSSTLIKDIENDTHCWTATRIAPESYYEASNMYRNAASEDFYVMECAMYERSQAKTPAQLKRYHEWIALYMHGEHLTTEEMNYRLQLAKSMTNEKR